ncbi:MAG: AmmeMemoRadiSam system protein A [Gammaproteobacteria bacterium]|nr:MAG: AmmeMemoRadiSam system protein A [Gammaproteobacteria bacterium]
MVPMSSREYSDQERAILLDIARRSIAYGLDTGRPLPVNVAEFPPHLQEHRASFVTLNERGQLRGCIGALEAYQPLVKDVADHAFAAAFQDPRFPPVQPHELPELEIHVSVLSPPEPMTFRDEADLLAQLRPGVDGLILRAGHHQGTFLPSVWEQLPRREDFLAHLKLKAGLPPDYWSDDVQVWRYTTEEFSDR